MIRQALPILLICCHAAMALSPAERVELESLAAVSDGSLIRIAERADAAALAGRVEQIMALDSLTMGSRRTYDASGHAAIHRYLRRQVEALADRGVSVIGELQGEAVVPVAADEADQPAVLSVGEERFEALPLWPNGPMPALCPAEGITAPLVDVGDGSWASLEGVAVNDAIAVMDFAGGRNWVRLVSLGARAVLVVEGERMTRDDAERLFSTTPVPMPRFYVDRRTADRLRRLMAGSAPPVATLRGGQVYAKRPFASLFVHVAPTEAIRYRVRPADLLTRLALEFGADVEELRQVNPNLPDTADLPAGATVTVPATGRVHRVAEDELLARLAVQFGVSVEAIRAANPEATDRLTAGQSLTIPNLAQPIVISCPIDSVSAVPDAPHGAHVASNLAAALTVMEHMASDEGVVRRRPIIFAFLDAETNGAMSTRALAESFLLADNALTRVEQVRHTDFVYGWAAGVSLATLLGVVMMIAASRLGGRLGQWTRPRRGWISLAGVLIGFVLGWGVNPLATPVAETETADVMQIARYDAALELIDGDSPTDIDGATAMWLRRDWLHRRLEAARVAIAERIADIRRDVSRMRRQLRQNPNDQSLADAVHASERKANELVATWIDGFVVPIREQSLGNRSLSDTQACEAFLDYLIAHPDQAEAMGLSIGSLRNRVVAEAEELRQARRLRENNIALAERLGDILRAGDPDTPVMGWTLDLGDATHELGITSTRGDRFRKNFANPQTVREYESRWHEVVRHVSRLAGWSEQWTFIRPDRDKLVHPLRTPDASPVAHDFWATAGVNMLPLGTFNDRYDRLDTPHDIPVKTEFENLSVQLRTLLTLMRLAAESPADSPAPRQLDAPKVGRIAGRVLQFNVRSGIDAQEPVAGALVYYSGARSEPGEFGHNTSVYRGARRAVMDLTGLSGWYRLPVETLYFGTKRRSRNHVYAYRLDREAAVFDRVCDEGRIGTQKRKAEFALLDQREAVKDLIVTDVYPLVLPLGPDPMEYIAVGNAKSGHTLRVVDALIEGEPQHYALDSPLVDFAEKDVAAVVLYAPEGRRLRFIVEKKGQPKLIAAGPLEGDGVDGKGAGYRVGPVRDEDDEVIDRNLVLTRAEYHVAEDMLGLASSLDSVLRDKGIRNASVAEALEQASAELDRAEAYAERHEWQAANGSTRQTWGTMVKFYPRIVTLGREAVLNSVLLMALLVPAAVFFERLVLRRKQIIARLGWVAVIFIAAVALLHVLHPAFQISVSPFIVVVAFTMILMATIVLVISYQRFEVVVRRSRTQAGEVEADQISLLGSLKTALGLGVSNLTKRPGRTFLTAFTVTVLTFSIVTFVSVRGEDRIQAQQLPLARDIEGRQVEPTPPAYSGVMFRQSIWQKLDDTLISSVTSEFGADYALAQRGWYIEVEGGNNADREGVNQLPVRREGRTHIATAIMVMEPIEVDFSDLPQTLSAGRWFKGESPYEIILPANAAQALGIDAAAVESDDPPVVLMEGIEWRVVGILDPDRADRVRDINGESLAAVDYLRSGVTNEAAPKDLVQEPQMYHMGWRRMVIVPVAAARDVGARVRSIVLRFDSPQQQAATYDAVAMRLNRALIGTYNGQPARITARQVISVAGVAKVIVPVVLCVLIVLNTMLGNVEERKGEVGMLGAVGLSPPQISFLLLSESLVFSILGIVIGTMGGLAFGYVIHRVNPTGNPAGFMGALSLNFASLASIGLAMGTGLVVLIATLIPARKAAALAAPSGMEKWQLPEPVRRGRIEFRLPFTLTRGNAVGMIAFLGQFLRNHADAASADFTCRDVSYAVESDPRDALLVRARMWLAPYDLDVSQQMHLRVMPSDHQGVFAVHLALDRTSGSEDAWLRTNYGFMDLIRYQFLLWRNLEPDLRQRYIDEGKAALAEKVDPSGAQA